MLPSSGLGEESIETVISGSDGLVGGHLAIRLDAVLQTVELPAGVANPDTGLADVDTDTLTLKIYHEAPGQREVRGRIYHCSVE